MFQKTFPIPKDVHTSYPATEPLNTSDCCEVMPLDLSIKSDGDNMPVAESDTTELSSENYN